MSIALPVGRPSKLTPELEAVVLDAVPKCLIPSQIAAYAMIHRSTLNDWLDRGNTDQELGVDSIYSQFSAKYHAARAEIVRKHLAYLASCPENSKPLLWILEKCFREDFGKESDELRELRAMFFKLLPTLTGVNNGNQITGSDSPLSSSTPNRILEEPNNTATLQP
jgi:hypothetical protein